MKTFEFSGNPKKCDGLVILLHGYGSNGNDLIGLSYALNDALPNYSFIAPNAPHNIESEGGIIDESYHWFSIYDVSFENIIKDFIKIIPTIEKYIEEQAKKFNTNNIILGGFSQGGMLAGYIALCHKLKLNIQCAISFSGALPFFVDYSSHIKHKIPICLIHGDKDDSILSHNMSIEAHDKLIAVDIDSHLSIIENMEHEINNTALYEAIEFLKLKL